MGPVNLVFGPVGDLAADFPSASGRKKHPRCNAKGGANGHPEGDVEILAPLQFIHPLLPGLGHKTDGLFKDKCVTSCFDNVSPHNDLLSVGLFFPQIPAAGQAPFPENAGLFIMKCRSLKICGLSLKKKISDSLYFSLLEHVLGHASGP
jgi:hypothetical protein